MDEIRKDVELAGIEADKVLADQVDLDFRIKVCGQGGCCAASARRPRDRATLAADVLAGCLSV